jgi:hypothetical protein
MALHGMALYGIYGGTSARERICDRGLPLLSGATSPGLAKISPRKDAKKLCVASPA